MDINEKDPIEIFVDVDTIILKKYAPSCIFCGEAKNVAEYRGKNICTDCMNELKNK
jgi:transcriptional pleiotropic regulator of transition state genes